MFAKRIRGRCALVASLISICLMGSAPAHAVTIWTDWTSATNGQPGSAVGTVNGVGVTYSGNVIPDTVINGGPPNHWFPNSSFIGGTSTASPSTVGDLIALNGVNAGLNPLTITFATPVVNPVFAIWSLGALPGVGPPATFTFIGATPIFEAGGPNAEFGGSAISVTGNVITGVEGNGVVQFTGTFSSLSWTVTFENFYGFTVGVNGPRGPDGVPEPASFVLLGTGLAAAALSRRRRKT
jgi:PEP-CTERM motif